MKSNKLPQVMLLELCGAADYKFEKSGGVKLKRSEFSRTL